MSHSQYVVCCGPGPVLDNYRRVGWQISWVGIGGGGGGGRLDIYTVDIAILIILTIVCYMYTGEKRKKNFHGQPRISCTWTFFSLLNNNNKKPSLFSFSESLFLHWWFFQLTFLFIPNKAIIISRTLGELIVLRKLLRPDHYGKGTKYIIRFFVK